MNCLVPFLIALFLVMPFTANAGAGVEDRDLWPSKTIDVAVCDCRTKTPTNLCSKSQCLAKPDVVHAAIKAWNASSGNPITLRVTEAPTAGKPYLLYVAQLSRGAKETGDDATWCFTYPGYQGTNDPHPIVIGDRCVRKKTKQGILEGVVQHETGHAVGLYHEQQREDRDTYLDVTFFGSTATNEHIGNSGRICKRHEQHKCQFTSHFLGRTYNYGRDLGGFNFQSIMLYNMSKNYQKCVLEGPIDPEAAQVCMRITNAGKQLLTSEGLQESVIGQRSQLSSGDVSSLIELYSTVQ